MAVFNEPNQWNHPLGNNADISILPDDAAATAGIASLQKLFQIINATPLEAGGIAPDREDVNALFKCLGDQIFYTQNGGIPSYNAAYDYIPGRVVLYDNNLYKCIQANGASSTVVAPDSVSPLGSDYWKDIENQDSTSLIPNQTIISELPLTDANLHLKDGALLSGSGAYSAYVDLIAELYNGGTASSSFCTEAEWQTSNTNYGFCNKFVYDSVNNTVRLPKVNSEHGALIKSYSSGTSWYRIYRDGWCEQGNKTAVPADSYIDVTLLVPFSDTNYNTQGVLHSPFDVGSDAGLAVYSQSTDTIRIMQGANVNVNVSWQCCGYIDISDLQTAPIYEYIVVGTISKTDIQIDIDQVLNDLNGKADTDLSNATPTSAFATILNNVGIRTIVDTYQNGDSWYRVWSDGYCEQGGVYDVGATLSDTYTSIILLKTLQTLTYADAICSTTNEFSASSTLNSVTAKSAGLVDSSHIQIRCLDATGDQTFRYIKWYVCGFTS